MTTITPAPVLPVHETTDTSPALPAAAVDTATRHVRDILTLAFEHTAAQNALVVYDNRCPLASALAVAYRRCLPDARAIDFDAATPETVLATFAALRAGDLVVLVQSTNFRLEAFRIRVELFKRALKVIEHPHLSRMPGQQSLYYIDALAYDPLYFRGTGNALKVLIDRASGGVIDSGGAQLVIGCGFEPAKLNVGDYRAMKNAGGQFPIGEVFTEALDLEAVNGHVRIPVFGDTAFRVNRPPQPITAVIERGRVVDVLDTTPAFEQVLANIRAVEGEVWVRELGFGLNRAFTSERMVDDIGTYERMCGMHLSLGAKHGYEKPQFRRADTRFHVDVFAATHTVTLGDVVVYRDGAWIPPLVI